MPKALQHNYPGWQDDPHAEDSNGESREVWFGAMRVVGARRARKLRKRGVPLMPLHAVYLNPCDAERGQSRAPLTPGNGPGKRSARYAWFECKDDAERRIGRRRLQCYMTATQADPNTLGRKAELARRLADQRAYFRKGGKLAATTYYQTFERYAGVPTHYEPNEYTRELWARPIRDTMAAAEQHFREVHGLEGEALRERMPIGWEPANAGVPTHYEPNDYTRALFRNATPEQLDAAARVDMTSYHEGLERAKLAEWERTRYAKE